MGRNQWDDDVEMGNVEIGDSNYGMQEHLGAAAQLRQIRGSLAQLAGQRFTPHAPAQKPLKSQYRDSGQIGIIAVSGVLTPSMFAAGNKVQLSGASTVFTSFKPNRAVCVESVQAVYTLSGATADGFSSVDPARDILIVGAFSGSINVFPNAPGPNTGIMASTFAGGNFGVGISWPTVNAGIPVTVNYLISPSILGAPNFANNGLALIAPMGEGTALPGATLTSFIVTVNLDLLGPQLR